MAVVKEVALIVAAGSGSRMGGQVPKQLQLLEGIPLAIYPGLQFRRHRPDIELVYVVQPGTLSTWAPLLQSYFSTGNWQLVEGGASRFLSVQQGIKAIKSEQSLVAIHDGARPFTSVKTISRAFESARENGSAVVAVPVKDSLRQTTRVGSIAVDRSQFYQVQTPQVFWLSDLQRAYQTREDARFTDDATVMEHHGHPIQIVLGDYENIKITTPEDWEMARLLFPKVYPGS